VSKRKVRKLLEKLSPLRVNRVPVRFLSDLRQGLEEDGWKVFVLPDGISDHESFVRAATALFPLNPPWRGNSWDAFADCLWEGLYELPDQRIAILWPDTTLRIPHPTTYELALSVFDQVSEGLADAKATLGKTKDLAVVVGT
jgi:hypothetical protein